MRRAIWKLGVVTMVVGAAAAMSLPFDPAHAANDDLAERSSIVFRGTVEQVGNTTMAALPPSNEALVVSVDAVIKKPHAVVLLAGDRVTVLSETADSFNEGEQTTFFTNGELFGDSLAVRLVGTSAGAEGGMAAAAMAGAMATNDAETGDSMSTAQVAAVLEGAEAVFVGRVKEVRLPTAAALQAAQQRITEHDPEWREAVVEVTSAIKGAEPGDEMVLRFPASLDVAWYRAPKPAVGQVSTFILRPDATSGVPTAVLAGQEVPAYQALEEGSILPAEAAQQVRALLQRQ